VGLVGCWPDVEAVGPSHGPSWLSLHPGGWHGLRLPPLNDRRGRPDRLPLSAVPSPFQLTRQDWPLLLISRSALGVDGPETLDPVRIQKGMFLLSMRGPQRNLYSFRPYDWGPYSSTLNADLGALVAERALMTEAEPGRTWARYGPTSAGEGRASDVASYLPTATVQWLGQARRFLTTRTFSKLLSEVYEMYPEYATQSRFQG
jgi:hypothetical protein